MMIYDKVKKPPQKNTFLNVICITLIWVIFLYSSVIQYKYFEISNAMLMLGATLLFFFLIKINGDEISIMNLFSVECAWMLAFMIYAFLAGLISSPNTGGHVSQCITNMEYMFIMFVIVNIIKYSGTDSFQVLLLLSAIILGIILVREPIAYTTGRYSISKDLNPNYLGMCLSAGIWGALCLQQKKKMPLTLLFIIVALLEYCILQTGSRKALIASGIIILLWLVFCFYPSISRESPEKKIMLIVLISIASIILLRLFIHEYSNSFLATRMEDLQTEATSGERSDLYRFGWQLFKEHPIFGIGFSGYVRYYGEHSHSTLVEVPVSSGILGATVYFTSYIISLRKCLIVYAVTKYDERHINERAEIKMILVFWVAMLFYCTCVIHTNQFLSYVVFGIIFGKTAYLEMNINKVERSTNSEPRGIRYGGRSIYIKD